MHSLTLQAAADSQRAPVTGWTRTHWEEAFSALVEPLVHSASPGGARLLLPGPISSHGVLATELEGFTRAFMMSAPWLATGRACVGRDGPIDLAGFFARGTLAGTDPAHPEHWGPVRDRSQHLVELAALGWALVVSREAIWDRFDARQRRQVGDYLARAHACDYFDNNWRLFAAVTHAACKRLDLPHDPGAVARHLTAVERMYLGDGWYGDGDRDQVDHYSAWGFNTWGLMWAWLDGDALPDLRDRILSRARAFVAGLPYLVASDGGFPAFGRSISYRFALVTPIVLGALLGSSDLPPGQGRAACSLVMQHFLSRPVLTARGHLAAGFIEGKTAPLERYSGAGSPYWAGMVFTAFLMPPEHPFWSAIEVPLPAQQGRFERVMPGPGLIAFGEGAHVQLVNQRAWNETAGMGGKYARLAYSSVFGPLARLGPKGVPPDNAILCSLDGLDFRCRRATSPRHLAPGFSSSRWVMTDVDPDGWVQTSVIIKGDVMVNLHWVHATREVVMREGGHALGYDGAAPESVSLRVEGRPIEAALGDARVCYIGALAGWSRGVPARPSWTGVDPRHRDNVVPVLEATVPSGGAALVALVCARVEATPIASLVGLARCELESATARLTFADGEVVLVQMGDARELDLRLGEHGVHLRGRVVMARVRADGAWLALDEDGGLRGCRASELASETRAP